MRLSSHAAWAARRGLIGKKGSSGEFMPAKVIKDVIISPNRNAYALVFEDDTILDMSTYDDCWIS